MNLKCGHTAIYCSPQKNENQSYIGALSHSCRNGYRQENKKKSNNPGKVQEKLDIFMHFQQGNKLFQALWK